MSTETNPFLSRIHGYFRNLLKWEELDLLWQQLRARPEQAWYVYAVGEAPPLQPLSSAELHKFIDELDQLLRKEHDYDYCGIVYVDNIQQPSLIKIYDPNNLGSSCGSGSLPPPLPGWILSHLAPCELQTSQILPGNRKRWWQRILAG